MFEFLSKTIGSWVGRKKERKHQKELLYGREPPTLKTVEKIAKPEHIVKKSTPKKKLELDLDELKSPSSSIKCTLEKKSPNLRQKSKENEDLPPKILFQSKSPTKTRINEEKTQPKEQMYTKPSKKYEFIIPSFVNQKSLEDDLPRIEVLSLREKSKIHKIKNQISEKVPKLIFNEIFNEVIKEDLKNLIMTELSSKVLDDLVDQLSKEFVNHEKEFLPLTKKELDIVDLTLDSHEDQNEILSSRFNVDMTRKNLYCLNDKQWLNDEVINFYMNLLGERKTSLKCHFFNTFFYPKLMTRDKYDYSLVRRWTKSVDLFKMDKIFVPIHLGTHWTLAVINLRDKRFEYYDSLNGSGTRILANLRKYIQDESMDKKKEKFNVDEFRDYQDTSIPQQKNGYDCGMFCCKYASFLSQDFDLFFSQKHMKYFRQRLCLSILRKKEI